MTINKHIAIITAVYENYDVLDDFIKSLEKQSDMNFHLFICDVSVHKKPIMNKIVPMTVLPSYNGGYAHGVNIGLKEALRHDFRQFCIMNNDTFFKSDFVHSVRKSLSVNPVSIIGGKIYYAPGYEYHKDRYSKKDIGNIIWYAGGTVDWNHALTPHRGVDEVDSGQYDSLDRIGFVNGCMMCFDKSVIDKIGFWDESYFLYFEDADYSVRARKTGIPLIYDPSIVIWHKNAQSTGGSGSNIHLKYQRSNQLRFGLRYAPFKTKVHLLINYLMNQ